MILLLVSVRVSKQECHEGTLVHCIVRILCRMRSKDYEYVLQVRTHFAVFRNVVVT